jgi:HEPN domain-containing protein
VEKKWKDSNARTVPPSLQLLNRRDLKQIALLRIREADLLFKRRKYDGAYYLAGYAIECGLKACIAKQTRRFDFPDKSTVNLSYTHDLEQLLKVAGLEVAFERAVSADPHLEVNWTVIKDWNEESRYVRHSDKDARDILSAITDRRSGILNWLKNHW